MTNLLPHRNKRSSMVKMVIIGALIVITWIPTLFMDFLVDDRSQWSNEVMWDITQGWGEAQDIVGPVISIPAAVTSYTDSGMREAEVYVLPEDLDYSIDLKTDVLSRGIYDSIVYTATVKGGGSFNFNDVATTDVIGDPRWEDATLSIGIPDTRGIQSATLVFNGEEKEFNPGVDFDYASGKGISVPISAVGGETQDFSFELVLRGSGLINIAPVGKTTHITMDADWSAPSFTGQFLPEERELTDDGFSATWTVASYGRSTPQSWISSERNFHQQEWDNIQSSMLGVSLFQNVDFYTMVDRALKYSILFITLTFVAFFMFEVISKIRIHPMNYLLVGAAMVLFYLVLLSFSEQIGFAAAYILATLAITGMVTLYSRSVLKARSRAGIIGALLVALYLYLYVLLQLEELSLIFGSVFLFIVLGSIMYLTRNVDWYDMSE